MTKAIELNGVSLKHALMLAPMAGFSDRAMRLISKRFGAEYTTTEMVSAKAVVYGDKKTARLARIECDEAPAAVQDGKWRAVYSKSAIHPCAGRRCPAG